MKICCPKVKTWLVTVEIGPAAKIGPAATSKFEVQAPTKRLALLNFRFDYEKFSGYNFCNVLKIGLKKLKNSC